MRKRVTILALTLVLLAAGGYWATVRAASVPALDHVVVIMEENKNYGEVIGSSSAPYINGTLVKDGALGTAYHALFHPSLPNYLALTYGSNYGVTTDCLPSACPIAHPSIFNNESSWKTYAESMPSNCNKTDSSPYVAHHNPAVYSTQLSSCSTRDVNFSHLATDFSSTSTTPAFSLVIPNVNDDMHNGCSPVSACVSAGDTWLKNHVPTILNSPAFTTQHSLLIVVWDEPEKSCAVSSCNVPVIFDGYGVTAGHKDGTTYGKGHYSLLHTIEVALGLPTLTSNDANAPTMSGMFG